MASPYSLNLGDFVVATVIATNPQGSSLESNQGQGALIITQPDAPINLSEDLSGRTATSL